MTTRVGAFFAIVTVGVVAAVVADVLDCVVLPAEFERMAGAPACSCVKSTLRASWVRHAQAATGVDGPFHGLGIVGEP